MDRQFEQLDTIYNQVVCKRYWVSVRALRPIECVASVSHECSWQ